jgi:hypothetical protein
MQTFVIFRRITDLDKFHKKCFAPANFQAISRNVAQSLKTTKNFAMRSSSSLKIFCSNCMISYLVNKYITEQHLWIYIFMNVDDACGLTIQ